MADALEAHGLSVRLGARTVLSDVSLSARAGEVLAILGPNGAGKSTLLRALVGLVPHEGVVQLDGIARATLSFEERARRLSYVPQQSQLRAPLTVREVVALGRSAHRPALARARIDDVRAIDAALADADVAVLAARSYSQLSTGEQKRVLLARALATGAGTLLLDEPTASLDIEHALRLFHTLRRLATEGRAVVLVLHQIEHALAFADRALLLAAGRLRASGLVAEVVTPANVRALYGVELVPHGSHGFRLPEAPP